MWRAATVGGMNITPRIADVLTRAAKTFVQAAIATATVSLTAGTDFSAASLRSIAIGAIAAGVSAAWNVIATSGSVDA